jgi:two-component system aerobic respiration control sensor histidine kinase ArcB
MDNIFFDQILAHLPGFVYWKDKNSRYQACNENLASAINLASRNDIVGKSDFDFPWASQYARQFIQEDKYVMRTGQLLVTEYAIPLANETGRWLAMRTEKRPLYNQQGEVIGVLAVAVDIGQKIAEANDQVALRESLVALTQASAEIDLRKAIAVLASSAAHDLRTLVASVESIAIILKTHLPVLTAFHMDEMAAAIPPHNISKRQLAALNGIPKLLSEIHHNMSFLISKNLEALSSARSKNEFVTCSVESCIENVLNYYPFKSGERYLIKWERGYTFDFYGDQLSFFRILANLVNNALRQIVNNRGGEICITTRSEGDNNILSVKDSAGGMPQEVKNALFFPFCSKEGGTGIGLAYCKMTMHRFGGDIVCRSIEGVGTEFDLIFPKCKELDISSDSEACVQ